jgi:hypothetical protein
MDLARAAAAHFAIWRRRRGLNAFARARPPLMPPSRPKATACGFFVVIGRIWMSRGSAERGMQAEPDRRS